MDSLEILGYSFFANIYKYIMEVIIIKTVKVTTYVIRFSNIANDFRVTMCSVDNKLFTDLDKVRSILEEHGYEELADRGTDPDVIARFINLNYTYSLRESYFNAPRAEIVKNECEFEVE